TEFISEHTYRSALCLVQVATRDAQVLIDPLAVRDLTPFWQALAAPGHETVAHAGREELNFSLAAIDRRPANLFDVQIAAGLVGYDYPAGYGSLLTRILNVTPHKGETRTDWRRRPLSAQQIHYAIEDVRHLIPLRDALHERLTKLGRLSWLAEEMETWQSEVENARSRERWRRVSGITGLSARSMAIVREVWRWREDEAQRRDLPAKRVLRDDLLVELAKRKTADPKLLRAVRGMEGDHLKRFLPILGTAIERALELPDAELPRSQKREVPPQVTMLGQFMSSALTSICHAADLAPSIVGTASDVRDLIAFRLGFETEGVPVLAQGWREEVVGHLIEDLLSGKVSIRIGNPLSEEPLLFEPYDGPPR
ncbi:MAG TPA: HRDC domain-containing protein, partial [Pirellulales bacterium]|nr:HRDC domain-containing protein [Pirellulales bacterium]